jgi:maltokinase
MLQPSDLQPLVASWLPAQRWFAGKGRAMTVTVRQLASASDTVAPLSVWLAEVRYQGSVTTETYQLPLVVRDEPLGNLEHVLLGSIELDGRPRWIYDALHDKDVTQWWLLGFRDERATDALRFHHIGDPTLLPIGESSLALTGEQSNTSLVYGSKAILKVFRRLEPGINPDVEIHEALTELGARHVARLLGSLTADIDGEQFSLAMLQEYLTTATDGWELAKISVRDLMAEADLHAEEAGGDFAGEAERLGIATAEVHVDLANAFGTDILAGEELTARAAEMNARLDVALTVVPQLAGVERALRAAFAAIVEEAKPVTTQRIHGDLHLGQVLRTARRWVFLDFEGEPVRPLVSRRTFDSALRDVAGMLRSFDYAANHQIVDVELDPQRQYRANEWANRNRTAFCDGYARAASRDPRDDSALLRAFEADKAVYEAVYEARHRPSWLSIPLASLSRLVAGGTAT